MLVAALYLILTAPKPSYQPTLQIEQDQQVNEEVEFTDPEFTEEEMQIDEEQEMPVEEETPAAEEEQFYDLDAFSAEEQ